MGTTICVICGKGETEPGFKSVVIDEGGPVTVLREVPALICKVCGEAYFDGETTKALLDATKEPVKEGVEFTVRKFSAAK